MHKLIILLTVFIHGLLEFSCYDQVEKRIDSEIMSNVGPMANYVKGTVSLQSQVELLNIAMGLWVGCG